MTDEVSLAILSLLSLKVVVVYSPFSISSVNLFAVHLGVPVRPPGWARQGQPGQVRQAGWRAS